MSCCHFFRVHLFAIGRLKSRRTTRPDRFDFLACRPRTYFESIDAVDASMVGLFSDFGGGAIRPRQTTKEIRLQRQGNGQK